jgi:hypothetical protein
MRALIDREEERWREGQKEGGREEGREGVRFDLHAHTPRLLDLAHT